MATWPSRDDPCPERGPGLSHVQNGSPECMFCGTYTSRNPVEPRARRARKKRSRREVEFTESELKQLEFIRFLHRSGRI